MIPKIIFLPLFLLILCISSCRKERNNGASETIPSKPQLDDKIAGIYILNEGNMNSNMASLDFYDYANGLYKKNIYTAANPSATLGLGDVGNDIGIYGSKMYIVVNASNKLEILDAQTVKRIKTIDIKNGRYLSFANGRVYVSAYGGQIEIGPNTPNGFVAEIDTSVLNITRTVTVGRQPEQLTAVNNKLYVANSGGYSPPHYERTVSVIDLNSFKIIKEIDVAINLDQLKVDSDENLYVSSRGDYYNTPSNLFLINTKKDIVTDTFNIAAANIAIMGDSAFVISTGYNYTSGGYHKPEYYLINTKTKTIQSGGFIKDGTENHIQTPYGLAIDPFSRNIFVTDAIDYISSGKIYCYDKTGKYIQTFTAGNIPSRIAFLYKSKK